MMSVSPATITVTTFERNGVKVEAYRDLEHLLASLLMNSGDQIPYLVRDKLLPEAIKAWDETKYREEHPCCNRHDDCNAADAKYREKNPGAKYIPLNFHCHDDECEECFGN